jgi:tetratricopeptide (TPR) repeat protein
MEDAMDTTARFDRLLADGLVASREGRLQAAIALFTLAAEVDPSSGIPHLLIASEHAGAGEFAAAELAFARAALLAPGLTLARYQLGLLQYSTQRAPLALLTWEPLFALPADDALHHFVRGFAALAQDALEEALEHFRRGLGCPSAPPPLCSDIVQVVEAVQALARDKAGQPEEPAASHVLLSGYGRGLH